MSSRTYRRSRRNVSTSHRQRTSPLSVWFTAPTNWSCFARHVVLSSAPNARWWFIADIKWHRCRKQQKSTLKHWRRRKTTQNRSPLMPFTRFRSSTTSRKKLIKNATRSSMTWKVFWCSILKPSRFINGLCCTKSSDAERQKWTWFSVSKWTSRGVLTRLKRRLCSLKLCWKTDPTRKI